MTTFGYAERPAGVTGPTQRNPLNERADPPPRSAESQLAVRGEG
ncbi:RNA polymerase subunit sigma-24, partial [Micromonospora chalcea]